MFEAQTMLPQNVFAFMNIKINMKINSLKILIQQDVHCKYYVLKMRLKMEAAHCVINYTILYR